MNDAADMAVYDALPAEVRDALKWTVRKWTAAEAMAGLRFMSARMLAATLTRHDREFCARENVYR